MSFETYHTLATSLLVFCGVALFAALVSLVFVILGWKTPKRKRRLLLFSGLVILAGLAIPTANLLFALVDFPTELTAENYVAVRNQMEAKASEYSRILPSQVAPSFSITTDEGVPFVFSNHKGSVVLINFFRTDCGPCNVEMPALQKIWEEHGGRDDFRMIAISRGESMDTIVSFKVARKLTFPFAIDADSSVYELFASEGIPRTYLFARDGTLLFQSIGFMQSENYDGDEEQIRTRVVRALDNHQ